MLRDRQEFVSTVAKHGTALIYMLLNLVNRKVYVGQTVQSVKKRFAQHAVDNCLVGRAIRKYGKAAFKLIVLDVVPYGERDDAERKWIRNAGCIRPLGYNLREGGESASRHSASSRNKMRKKALLLLTPKEIERRRKRGRAQAAQETKEDKEQRLKKAKQTKATPEWKAEMSTVARATKQQQLSDPAWVGRWNTTIEASMHRRLADWKAQATRLPVAPRDRIPNKHYIDHNDVLYVARKCNNPNPMLCKVNVASVLKDRVRTSKKVC